MGDFLFFGLTLAQFYMKEKKLWLQRLATIRIV